ncbi:MAG: hypothetical protein IT287_09400 [Bdellovibrionaceae bacterium]|nr:hypothetical protein [Pseudobdellovibrionaceae bacterium]
MYQLTRLLSMLVLAATIACGPQNKTTEQVSEGEIAPNNSILRMMGSEGQLLAVDANDQHRSVKVSADDHIVVLDDVKIADDGQEWISVAIDKNNDEPSETVYVRPQDLLGLPLAVITMDNDQDWVFSEDNMGSPEIINVTIAGHEKALPALRIARMTYCYRYVKKYLLKIGLVKTYLPGASAYQAATILPKHGFKKVSRTPSQAIVNDVCVYKGGPSGHGHIEIKTSKGWYYGYGYKAAPIKNRIFIGCFHK